MKKLFKPGLLMLFVLPLSLFAQVNNNDTEDILKVVKLYLTVTDHKDSPAIEKAFLRDAKLLSVTKSGSFKQMSLAEWWSRVSRISNPVVRKSKITILDIAGISAVAKVEFETSSDHISLLKINNEWKIVSKTLSVVL